LTEQDLSYLNRDLSKVIIIDTDPSHVKLQPENAIILPKWKGQPRDKNLVGLIPFLEYVATMGVEDVRTALKSFEGKDIPAEFALREAKAREAFNKALAEEQAKKPKHSAGGWLMGALGLKDQSHGMVVGDVSVTEGFKQGKMLSDQIRERGQANYEAMEKEIRENGEKWLKEMQEEEKRLMEEQMKSMKKGAMSWFK
jgi:mitochondrial import inner membrane translocase subunit TIM50